MIYSRTTDVTGSEADLPDSTRALCEALVRADGKPVVPSDDGDKRDLIDAGVRLATRKLSL